MVPRASVIGSPRLVKISEMKVSYYYYSRGRQPLGLVAQNREQEMSELFKIFTFVFFFGFGLYLVQEKRGKKNFSNRTTFPTFRLSVKICGKHNSKSITFFDLRPGEENFCSDRNRVPRYRCRPPPMPPLPPSPQKRVFSPQFSTSNSSEVSEFFEIVPGG